MTFPRRLREEARRYGWVAALRLLVLQTLDRALGLQAMAAVVLDRPSAAVLPPGLTADFLTAAELRKYVGADGYAITGQGIARMEANGVEGYAIRDGERLAHLTHYARRTFLNDDYYVDIDEGVAYEHKAFTHPDYRGRGLYPAGLSIAFEQLRANGVRRVVSEIDARNFASLRAHENAGYRRVGWVLLRVMGTSVRVIGTPGCERCGCRFRNAG